MMLDLHPRKPLTTLQRAALFRDHNGMCCLCSGKIHVSEKWIDEHIRPLSMGGTNDMENRGPAHVKCAGHKTSAEAAPRSKAKRIEAKHIGATVRKPWPKRGVHNRIVDNTKYVNRDHS